MAIKEKARKVYEDHKAIFIATGAAAMIGVGFVLGDKYCCDRVNKGITMLSLVHPEIKELMIDAGKVIAERENGLSE